MSDRRSVPRVFIISTARDIELARDVARRLALSGLEAWHAPDRVRPGEDWAKTLGECIRSSDAVLVLLTQAALDSPWTAYEMGVADGADKPILPVIAGVGLPPPSSLLASYQAVPYDRLDEAVRELAHRLRGETAAADDPART